MPNIWDKLDPDTQKRIYDFRLQRSLEPIVYNIYKCKRDYNRVKKNELIDCIINYYMRSNQNKYYINGYDFLRCLSNNLNNVFNKIPNAFLERDEYFNQNTFLLISNGVSKFEIDYEFLYENGIEFEPEEQSIFSIALLIRIKS